MICYSGKSSIVQETTFTRTTFVLRQVYRAQVCLAEQGQRVLRTPSAYLEPLLFSARHGSKDSGLALRPRCPCTVALRGVAHSIHIYIYIYLHMYIFVAYCKSARGCSLIRTWIMMVRSGCGRGPRGRRFVCPSATGMPSHTHTHMYIYIYIYISRESYIELYMCLYILCIEQCVYIYTYIYI